MEWQGKSVDSLTNDQLTKASQTLTNMKSIRADQIQNRRDRHKDFDFNLGMYFQLLEKEVQDEMIKRGI